MKLTLDQAFSILQISKSDIQKAIDSIPSESPTVWEDRTKSLHTLINTKRKSLIFNLHPDRNVGGEEQTKQINAIADDLIRITKVGPPAPPPITIMQFPMFHSWTDSSTTTSTTTGGFYWTTVNWR